MAAKHTLKAGFGFNCDPRCGFGVRQLATAAEKGKRRCLPWPTRFGAGQYASVRGVNGAEYDTDGVHPPP